jgi:hypothetical protein
MASPLIEFIARIRGMVSTGKTTSEVVPFFDTLTERAQAVESELSALKAEAEDAALESKNDILKAETQAIQATLEQAMEEIKRLRADANERDWHNGQHDKKMIEVMVFIAEISNENGRKHPMTEAWISLHFDIGIELATHYLAELNSRGMIQRMNVNFGGITADDWRLTNSGRAYLASRDLLK